MDRFLVAIVLSVALLVSILSETRADSEAINEAGDDKRRVFWFGPRLGRRKRNPNEHLHKTSLVLKDQLDSLMDILQNSPWAIVAVNAGKRNSYNFVPRLGRDSDGEEKSNAVAPPAEMERWFQEPELFTSELMSQRSPPFAPRLGKRAPYAAAPNDRP